MDDGLYDTSWTLYLISNAKSSYRDLLSADQRALDRRAKQFRDFVNVNKPAYDSDSENERTGGLRDCTWKALRDISKGDAAPVIAEDGILVSLIYDKATYKFALCGSDAGNPLSLLLTKGPAATVKRFTSFVADAFHASIDPLKLPTSLLQNTLESYLKIVDHPPLEDSSLSGAPANQASMQLLKNVLSNLKVTLAFAAPVAPQLKSLDLDIPSETVNQFLDTTQNGRNARSSPRSVLGLVSQHLHNKTGLKIPVLMVHKPSDTVNGTSASTGNEDDAVIRISKITCAAFAISVDGRLKFASKALESAMQFENIVRKANGEMFATVEREAVRRSKEG